MELDSHLKENPLQHSKGWIDFFHYVFFERHVWENSRYWWSPQRNVETFVATKPGFLVAKDEMLVHGQPYQLQFCPLKMHLDLNFMEGS